MSAWQIIAGLVVLLGFGVVCYAIHVIKPVSLKLGASVAKLFSLTFEANAAQRDAAEPRAETAPGGQSDHAGDTPGA